MHRGRSSYHPGRSNRISYISAHGIAFLFFLVVLGAPADLVAGLVVRPVYVFLDAPGKSTVVTVRNDGDNPVEVAVDVRYGYHTSNDTGGLVLVYPESLTTDDHSMATWVKAYPPRFVIGSMESQGVRIFVAAPPGTPPGEYWARMLFTPHPTKSIVQAKAKPGPALQIITAVEIPLHYRVGKVSTGIDLDNSPPVTINQQSVDALLHFRRLGNASFWGQLRCRVLDHNSKAVSTFDRHLVVYKENFVRLNLPLEPGSTGPYTLDLTAETKRDDIAPKEIVHADARRWTFPIAVQ